MRISIFGLGYVGCVSAACLAEQGFHVVGVDTNSDKVSAVNDGRSPIVEKDLDALISKSVVQGKLRAMCDSLPAVHETELSLVCVGTPSLSNGAVSTTSVENVSAEIGKALKSKSDYHVVVYRSTLLPGIVGRDLIPVLERESGKKAGIDFGVVIYPEFMREATAIHDYYNPPKTVVGVMNERDLQRIEMLYKNINSPAVVTSLDVAGMLKYIDNAFHALKVTFANEVGTICKSLGIDSHKVMEIFCTDTKLNLSPYYLKPGFAFGGSCLPKDLRALTQIARQNDLDISLLPSIIPSNERHIKNTIRMIQDLGRKKLGFLGIAFKAGTDDFRESPLVELVEFFLGKGYEIKIYDRYISLSVLQGSNKKYIEERIPHISKLMCQEMSDVVEASEIVVIGNKDDGFKKALELLRDNQFLIDLVRLFESPPMQSNYIGIAW